LVDGRSFATRDRPHRIRLARRRTAKNDGKTRNERSEGQHWAARHAIGPPLGAMRHGKDERGHCPRQLRKDNLAQIAQAQPRVAQRSRSGKRQR
jgi:hypothetical protein